MRTGEDEHSGTVFNCAALEQMMEGGEDGSSYRSLSVCVANQLDRCRKILSCHVNPNVDQSGTPYTGTVYG